ncbi:MAG: NAD(P)/FAD-dependent oxidoreductase [Planctomycetaceae bacterium]|nr:NAD(P)/FAD-dependent oxidoreductase [Planctomycetaceae bacterium]
MADSNQTNRIGQHWCVAGGGILGMTIALRLSQQGHKVTIIEGRDNTGGLADAWQIGDITWDRHYHVTLLSDLHMRGLLEELGIESEMDWVETRTGFYTDGHLYSMSNTVEFLKFPPLGLIDKFRLGATIFLASRIKNWKKLENTYVADWLTRLSGRRTFEKMWLPLLRAKLGECWKDTSAAFIWATIARMYAARRSGLKKEMFGYVRGGYHRILNVFEEKLRERGVTIQCGTPVTQIVPTCDNRVVVTTSKGEATFDRVVSTLPSPVLSEVLPELNNEQRSLHEGIRYHGIVCASVLLKNPISPYYVTNITDSGVPFTAVIEMTALVDPDQTRGHSLIYLPKYVTPDHEAFQRSDKEIEEEFLSALDRMYEHFSRSDVLAFRVSRVRHVFALPTLGYSERVPPIRTNVDHVYAVNSSHIVNGTLNVNETIRLANEFVCRYGEASPLPADSDQPSSAGKVSRPSHTVPC